MIICHVGPPWGHLGTHGVPKTALKPIWGPKTPLKGPRRAKIGTNASHAVQLTTLGPKNQILTVSATFGDFGSF